MRRWLTLVAGLALAGSAFAQAKSEWRWNLPAGLPVPPVPADNPMSEAKIALGRRLFFEADLSLDGTMSCATCHGQRDGFTDGAVTHPGVHGDPGLRNVQPLLNVAWNSPLTWANPHLRTLEQQAPVPITGNDPMEMGMNGREAEISRRLGAEGCYRRMFRAAFPETRGRIDLPSISKALASFERTMISFDTAWDRARAGGAAMPALAQRGEALFRGAAGCASCHSGVDFTDRQLHPFATTAHDIGAARATGEGADSGLFRTPGLRDAALTGPYLHDGSAQTLAEAILRHGTTLAREDEDAILAFLDQLTDTGITTDPRFAVPAARCGRRT